MFESRLAVRGVWIRWMYAWIKKCRAYRIGVAYAELDLQRDNSSICGFHIVNAGIMIF